MADVPSIAASADVAHAPEPARDDPTAGALDVLRDIVRGGLAGLIVGIVVAGIGGRLVMRLAALLVPGADGAVTENGNRVGDITLEGTLALIIFIGLFFGVAVGALWVTIRAFLPRSAMARAAVSVPIALALGTSGLIDPRNRDFAILGNDPLVVASLVILVGLFGPALVLVEGWLEPRLARPASGDRRTITVFAVLAAIGLFLFVVAVIPLYFGPRLRLVGISLVVVGVATLVTWFARINDRAIPAWALVVGRVGLVAVVVAGMAAVLPDVADVLDR
ncbi:MAG: hypothetical protein ACLGIJ_00560 [Candidatus Limnocylindria bacterium]